MNKAAAVWRLSRMELMRSLRSTKMLIAALFLIFVNMQIAAPLRALSIAMGERLSLPEPFAAIGNSGVVVLILPLFFITMMADFPREGEAQYFYQIRCSKRTWVAAQIAYAVESAVLLVLFVFAASVLLLSDRISLRTDYSDAVTGYVALFPERAGEYVVQLIPENLYNQIPLPVAAVHTGLLLIQYFIMLAMLILVFSLLQRKTAGILLDGILVFSGAAACAARTASMWMFPMAHTITWLHYAEYQRKPIQPMWYSYLYFGIINTALAVLSIVLCKRRSSWKEA